MTLENIDSLFSKACQRIENARFDIVKSINHTMIETYFRIGMDIVLEEQKGAEKGSYGEYVIQTLSKRLTNTFGKGFTETNLRYMRTFYLVYGKPSLIHHAARDELEILPEFKPKLSWTHYRLLIKVKNSMARAFYEIECQNNNWSTRELERQINSLLYERLAKSKDKKRLLDLSLKGQEIQVPGDIIKDPFVLEFTGFPETTELVESKLEQSLINNLQKFLLELGKGFSFVARQKRLTLDGDHLYVDLVFYHIILKSYILIDIKTCKLTHGDMGQMLNYVNYYDQECLSPGDNSTIGLILCTEKNDAQVKYTLGNVSDKIFASRYQLHLPSEIELKTELQRELSLINRTLKNNED